MASDLPPLPEGEKNDQSASEVYYVQIKDAVALRKTVLLASRDIIQLLHKFENFKERRELKKQLLARIKVKIGEINELAKELKLDLPSVKFKDSMDDDVDISETLTIQKEIPKPKEEEDDSAINELENSLAEIEAKLQNMMK